MRHTQTFRLQSDGFTYPQTKQIKQKPLEVKKTTTTISLHFFLKRNCGDGGQVWWGKEVGREGAPTLPSHLKYKKEKEKKKKKRRKKKSFSLDRLATTTTTSFRNILIFCFFSLDRLAMVSCQNLKQILQKTKTRIVYGHGNSVSPGMRVTQEHTQ